MYQLSNTKPVQTPPPSFLIRQHFKMRDGFKVQIKKKVLVL